ncbi:Kinesin-like protein FLA10 [Acorus gramineus]|uniref:Kinesin-like protein FLA10 n=1 Tax=Acorus gramineus TaxID=55184 RepID=A0AAV9ACJ2_ACOGR|nr:Kinesin-like protein FLA10 [Acorus gramineus]
MPMETPNPSATVRRNPHRRARPTPSTTNDPDHLSMDPSLAVKQIRPFPLHDLLEPSDEQPATPAEATDSENLRVFVRIRPLETLRKPNKASSTIRSRPKAPSVNAIRGGQSKKIKAVCLSVNGPHSLTLVPPPSMVELKRAKTEAFEGFSFVFPPESLQREVYDRVMEPLINDFLGGKSHLLAAMGATGSGKTHTVFGTPREPGLVSLALQRLFGSNPLRSYYLSMFEIYSERTRGERLIDLLSDGAELSLVQSVIKGQKEVLVSNVVDAECVIARGRLKRMTAATNSNHQSRHGNPFYGRSQCIINIRCDPQAADPDNDVLQNKAVLTIADLAGAEREKRTGNQGMRLLESNAINNTSMVFGQCLRVLTVKSGEDDYLDTSMLLRQASPYMKIKFCNVEESSNLPCLKRQPNLITKIEQPKRRKLNNSDAPVFKGGKHFDGQSIFKTVKREQLQQVENIQDPVLSTMPTNAEFQRVEMHNAEYCVELRRREREGQIMQSFSRALWNVLKQYKQKLEESDNTIQRVEQSLMNEKARTAKLEKALENLRRHSCSCHKQCLYSSSPKFIADVGSRPTVELQDEAHSETNNSVELDNAVQTFKHDPTDQSQSPELAAECRYSLDGQSNISMAKEPKNSFQNLEVSLTGQHNEELSHSPHGQSNISPTEASSNNFSQENEAKELLNSLEGIEYSSYVGPGSPHSKASENSLTICGIFPEHNISMPVGQNHEIGLTSQNSEELNSSPHGQSNMSATKDPSSIKFSQENEAKEHLNSLEGTEDTSPVDPGSPHSKASENNLTTCGISREMDVSIPLTELVVPPRKDIGCTDKHPVTMVLQEEKLESIRPQKPRWRLLPTSAMLLEDSSLDTEDQNADPKGRRGCRKVMATVEKGRTPGSISLVHMLRRNLQIR